ncbi:hypothetical protein OEZ49_20225 [Ruegeria sp. WL0004]|uniref:Uncharacterized protein n=1 Tax=Ruegeria marisflavi TaxID=2984152 RepID=A0ABT2WVZ7_9RHOB|nr:hypothetical protein [Ruegeria sp. WL0004]MCU9840096.1 hypothetical protein [Ruegeria sp. WL0004]
MQRLAAKVGLEPLFAIALPSLNDGKPQQLLSYLQALPRMLVGRQSEKLIVTTELIAIKSDVATNR